MISFGLAISLLVVFLVLLTIYLGVKIVPQSKVYVIERFGRYHRTLNAGLSLIIPYLDTVAHRIDILERQLESQQISVITKETSSGTKTGAVQHILLYRISMQFV